MKRRTVVTIVILSALFLTAGVTACKHGHRPGGFDEFDLAAATDRIAHRLDLTESQKADLKQISTEIAAKAKGLHAEREDRLQEFADLIRQDRIDQDTVDRMIAAKMEKMREMVDFAVPRLIAFHETLTPEQKDKIAVHIEDHAAEGCRFGSH